MSSIKRLLISILPLFLCSCQSSGISSFIESISSSEESSESTSGEEVERNFIGGNLIFTELYVDKYTYNRGVEITNISNQEMSLNGYMVNIYRDVGENSKPTETIALNGQLGAKKSFIIVYEGANDELKAKADLISDQFLTDGSFPMTITYNNLSDYVDIVGYVGYDTDIFQSSDAVRKTNRLIAREQYAPYDWIRYPVGTLTNLGNLNCIDNDILMSGPKLTSDDFSKPYAYDKGNGGGGLLEVTLTSTIDGDTSKFNFGYSLSEFDITGVNSLRYYGINTPEIAHNGNPADPYGPEARDFTNSILKKAKHFQVQSVEGYSLTETYGRVLGYLWISYENNPEPSDYFLINHYIIQNGFSRVNHVTRGKYNDLMTYQGVSYVEYMYDALNYAILNKINIHSIPEN